MRCTSHVNGHVFEYDAASAWADDFSSRVRSHEYPTNRKLLDLMQTAPAGAYIVDAGAHVGDTGLLLASEARRLGVDVHILEIDPDATKLGFIEDTAARNGLHELIATRHCAVGGQAGAGALRKADASGDAIHAGAWFVVDGADFAIARLDDVLPDDSDVFLIKLDTEGFEVDALMGCTGTIARARPRYFMVEMWQPVLMRHGRSSQEIMDFMQAHRYRLLWKGGQDALFAAEELCAEELGGPGYWEERNHATGQLTRWLPVLAGGAGGADGDFASAASGSWRATFRRGEFAPHNRSALRGGRVTVLSAFACDAALWCGHGSSFRWRGPR